MNVNIPWRGLVITLLVIAGIGCAVGATLTGIDWLGLGVPAAIVIGLIVGPK